jgi:hypothetical protein
MYYLVFKPQRKRVSDDRYRYDYRNQSFIGFTQSFTDAISLAVGNHDANYQIYESSECNLDFHRRDAIRYAFRKHYGTYILYKRKDDVETLIHNPLEDESVERQRLDEIKNKRLEGIRKKMQELADVEKQIESSP